MGDFSRDTFRLTNVMHRVWAGAAVTDPRHYMAVRTQQGVPVLDADVNEGLDIGRFSQQIQLRSFFGDGIPSENDGFRIGPVTADNDFAIGAGMALVGGALVFNPHAALTYLGQAAALGVTLPALAPPNTGSRVDLAYLEVWEEEVRAAGSPRADTRIVHPVIGMETCTRIERRWVVRVAPDVQQIGDVAPVAGHVFMPLARLRRSELQPRIQAHRIDDLRRTDVNVVRHLKIPFSLTRGALVVDSTRLAELLETLRGVLTARLAAETLHFTGAVDPERTLVLFALQHVLQVASTGALQARTRSLTAGDALQVLRTLLAGQREFVQALEDQGDTGTPLDDFVVDYRARLDALGTALDDDSLLDAYGAQQEVNAWLAAADDFLPEGNAFVQFLEVSPAGAMVAGTAYAFTVEARSDATAPGTTEEVFDVTATLSSDLWSVTPPAAEITLANLGGTGTVVFTVTPHAGNAQSTFTVVAAARRNPTGVRSTQPGIDLEIGEEPPIGAIVGYAGPPLNVHDEPELTVAQITSGFGVPVNFSIRNRTDTTHSYTLEWFITRPAGEDTTDWSPLEASPNSVTRTVAPGTTDLAGLRIRAPGGTAAGPTGTMHVRLVALDGSALPAPQQELVTIDFVVIA